MSSFKNFSKRKQAEREGSFYDFDNPYSHDPIREESIEYEEWSKFLSYYRYYVDKFATDILGNDGKLVGTFNFEPIVWEGKPVYKTPIMTLDYLDQFNIFDLGVGAGDYSTLSINVQELYNQGIITEYQYNRLLGLDLYGGLYVTIGYLGTLFTFISNFATADYLPVGEIAQDATFLCGWNNSPLRSNGFGSEAYGLSLKIQ